MEVIMSEFLDGKVAQIRAYEGGEMTAPEVIIKLTKYIEHRMRTNLVKFGDTLNPEYNHRAVEDADILECLNKLKEGKDEMS